MGRSPSTYPQLLRRRRCIFKVQVHFSAFPLITNFYQDGAHQTEASVLVGENAHNPGAAVDFTVVGFSVHGRTGDTACLIPHLDSMRTHFGRLPHNVVTNAGYGSEENYAYLEHHSLGNFVKYNTF